MLIKDDIFTNNDINSNQLFCINSSNIFIELAIKNTILTKKT